MTEVGAVCDKLTICLNKKIRIEAHLERLSLKHDDSQNSMCMNLCLVLR